MGVIYLKFEPLRVPLWIEGFGTDVGFESCTSKLQLKKREAILVKKMWHFKERVHTSQASLTSTKASVRSLARSITGKWRPATILAFSFPGMIQFQFSL